MLNIVFKVLEQIVTGRELHFQSVYHFSLPTHFMIYILPILSQKIDKNGSVEEYEQHP